MIKCVNFADRLQNMMTENQQDCVIKTLIKQIQIVHLLNICYYCGIPG